MATAVLTKPQEPQTEEQLAARYAGDLVYRALLEAGQPLKASEVTKAVARPDVDLKLTRVVLSTNPGMTAMDRRWTIWTRYLDTKSTVDNNLRRILNTFGQPVHLPALARELSAIYHRPAEIYEQMLAHLTGDRSRYALVGQDYVIPADWLLYTETGVDDEIQFDNFLDDEDVDPFRDIAQSSGLDWRDAATITAFLNAAGKPVKNKAIQFLAYQRDRAHFDGFVLYSQLFSESGATPLSDGTWIGPKLATSLLTHFPKLAEQEVSENAEAEAQEAAQPLTINDEQREQLIQAVLGSENTSRATRLLEEIFEIAPDDRTYDADLQLVISTLASDERALWLGSDRFRPQGTIPAYVFTVPGLLEIPEVHYLDAEGNDVDLLIETDGFDGGLERDIMNPLMQDVMDEEPVPLPDPNPPVNARAVVKYHHKQIGTMPLCQFPSGFFPPEPAILEADFILPGGQAVTVYVNNETRLMYGLLDWFQSIPIDSGATFTLERQSGDRYLVTYNDESEPAMFISRNRINELITLQEDAETNELPTYDIIRQIMEHYRKGIEPLTLHTEVNIVRRTTRRLVASILSEYYCFLQRGGAWVYDAKKREQGFDKSKRKYLVK